MKKGLRWAACSASLLLVLSACPLQRVLTGSPLAAGPVFPSDQVRDVARSTAGPFEFKTLVPVDLKLEVGLYELSSDATGFASWTAASQAGAKIFGTVIDRQGQAVWTGQADEGGVLSARLMLPAAPEDLTCVVSSAGYRERRIVVEGMSRYSEIHRIIAMQPEASGSKELSPLPDRDGDSVPDVYDAFPDDPGSAFAYQVPADGPLTIAFEDLFGQARAGDADYNDFIGAYQVTEVARGSDNAIVRVEGVATSIAKIAGYNHDFLIAIDSFTGGADLEITYPGRTVETRVASSPAVIPVFISTRDTVGQQVSFELRFDEAQPAETMDAPPYNPFLHVRNTGYDIHLIGEQALPGSKSTGHSFQDAEGFPWALLVPSTWVHPLEGQRIEIPYPRFTLWRESFGASHTDWYLHYYDPYVPPTTRSAWVAGYVGSGSRDVAASWKQDLGAGGALELTSLSDTSNARAASVFVDGSDVHVAGYTTNTSGQTAASYWKNGVRTDLYTHPVRSARASAVFVSGSDVYVAGYIETGTGKAAGYWKNGAWQLLYDTTAAEATDIVVSNSVVYVSGYVTSGGKENACYWKNGARTDLYTADYSAGYAIAVSGSDVYVAGYYIGISSGLNAGYWKNGSGGLVTLGSGGAKAFDVTVSGSDVYVAGYYTNPSSMNVACYWKNGSIGLVDLYNDGANWGQAHAIYVDGTDVYAAGYVNEGTQNACYWKNASRILLSPDVSDASCIVVAE